MVYLIKFHIPVHNGLLVTVNGPNDEEFISMAAMSLF
jgi:hypothetical protein